MRRLPLHLALVLSAPLLWASPAAAHIGLISPPSRYGESVLKEGPCGMTGGTRSDNVTVFEPGQTIEVVWEEYIDHPSHYRISFDQDGDDDFVDPATMTEEYSNDAVLLDGIEDRVTTATDNEYRVMVTLPDVECDNCTLQLIQVMYDKPPYTTPGNDIYYQCADLVLRRSSGGDAGTGTPDAGGGPTDAGGAATDAGGTSAPRSSDGGCCTVAPGARRDPVGALAFAVCLAALVAARRRCRR